MATTTFALPVPYNIYLTTAQAASLGVVAGDSVLVAPDDAVATYGAPYGFPAGVADYPKTYVPAPQGLWANVQIGSTHNNLLTFFPYPLGVATFDISYDQVSGVSPFPVTHFVYHAYWQGTFLVGTPTTVGPTVTKIGKRLWVTGFEIPGAGPEGLGISTNLCARAASRTGEGMGLALRGFTNSTSTITRAQPAGAYTVIWERFYFRIRRFPTGLDMVWSYNIATEAAVRHVLYVGPGGQLSIYYFGNGNVAPGTFKANFPTACALDTWYRMDVRTEALRVDVGTAPVVTTCAAKVDFYINGAYQVGDTQTIVKGGVATALASSQFGNSLTGTSNGLEIDIDDWVGTLPAALVAYSGKVYGTNDAPFGPVEIPGHDLTSGSHVQLIHTTGRGADDSASWVGDWRSHVSPMASGATFTTSRSSTLAGAKLHVTTDYLDRQLGAAAWNVAMLDVSSSAQSGTVGLKVNGVETTVAVAYSSGFWMNYFGGNAGGETLPLTPRVSLEPVFTRSALAGNISIQGVALTVEYLGSWGTEDIGPPYVAPVPVVDASAAIVADAAAAASRVAANEAAAGPAVVLWRDNFAPRPDATDIRYHTVGFGARASGGSGSYEYKFWKFTGGVWSITQDWNASALWTWDVIAEAVGLTSRVRVWVRNTGSVLDVPIAVDDQSVPVYPNPMQMPSAGNISFNFDQTGVMGVPATATIVSSNSTQFQWWVYDFARVDAGLPGWRLVQDWGVATVFHYTFPAPGLYAIFPYPLSADGNFSARTGMSGQSIRIWGAIQSLADPTALTVVQPSAPTNPAAARRDIHNAPYPDIAASVLTSPGAGTVYVRSGVWTGNGTGQDIALTVPIHWLWFRPLNTSAGGFWVSTNQTAHSLSSRVLIGDLIERVLMSSDVAGKFQVAGVVPGSNALDLGYQWVAVSDPNNRFMLNGAFSHKNAGSGSAASHVNALAVAAFTPDYLFADSELTAGTAAPVYYLKGPGMPAAQASQNTAAVETPVITFGAGSLTSATAINLETVQSCYSAWRKNDGLGSGAVLFDALTYTGDGAATRDIAVTLGGRNALFTLVTPHNGVSYVRDPGHLGVNSQQTSGANSTTGIRAVSVPDTVTVGIALNALGIVYDLFAIADLENGLLTPTPPTGCPLLLISPTDLPLGASGLPYNQVLSVANAVGATVWAVTSGALPTGLALSGAGVLSGTPTVTGAFAFTVSVTDANGCVGTRFYSSLLIGGSCPVITVTPATLTGLILNTPYNLVLAAAGGVAPYTWAVTAGALPLGLVLSGAGVVSGTPTVLATGSVTIQCLDANGCPGYLGGPGGIAWVVSSGTNCPCTTLTGAVTILAARLQDSGLVHWTSAELTRYLIEALRTWNALTGAFKNQGTFNTSANTPFYDLPTVIPTLRSYNVKDIDLITDIQYSLMEPPTPTGWTGTLQFTLPDVTRAVTHRRDRFLYETGMVIHRLVENIAPAPADGRLTLDDSIMTVRRAAYISATGAVYPLTRDDEWSLQAFRRQWPFQASSPALLDPMVYSVGVTPPLVIQIGPPLSAAGLLDLLVVSAAGVHGQTTPCLDPTGTPTYLGVPDDWTWVVKFGALAELLNQQGVTYDPQRAAYCESRWRLGIQLASAVATVLAARISGQPIQVDGVANADQFHRSWQATTGAPVLGLLAGNNLMAFGPVPDGAYPITVDVIQNAPLPVLGTDCYGVEAHVLDAVLDYAQHLAMFKEGPDQLRTAMDLLERFYRVAGVVNAVEWASVMNRPAIQQQTMLDEIQTHRVIQPPPVNPPSGGSQ